MSLPTPNLDDRTFQDIVDEAKRRIAYYCPEWTDHNVSDPGVALIELFAWMTEMVIFRLNQTPDRLYLKFLDLHGLRPKDARPARVAVTFELNAPATTVVNIPAGTPTSTRRAADASDKLVQFATLQPATIFPPEIVEIIVDPAGGQKESHAPDSGRQIDIFAVHPRAGDRMILVFRQDVSHLYMVLKVESVDARGTSVDPTNPPLVWEVWQDKGWRSCEVVSDSTGGFNFLSGEVRLHVPRADHYPPQSSSFAISCRYDPRGYQVYTASPKVRSMRAEALGVTVLSEAALWVRREVLGRSNGEPGQRFKLLHGPVLPAQGGEAVEVVQGDSDEVWQRVDNFAGSNAGDRHYIVDSILGEVVFGPAPLLPDGREVYRFGAVPAKGAMIVATYRYGGGRSGNVPANFVTERPPELPFVKSVVNRGPAAGGEDAESLEALKVRAPRLLLSRDRAITRDDYAFLAEAVPGVSRASCIGAGELVGRDDQVAPGWVRVVVLPEVAGSTYVRDQDCTPSPQLIKAVKEFIDARKTMGSFVEVVSSKIVWVAVEADVRYLPTVDQEQLGLRLESLLCTFLHPVIGGEKKQGWPFGRKVTASAIYRLLASATGVEYVTNVKLYEVKKSSDQWKKSTPQDIIDVGKDGLVASRIEVKHNLRRINV